MQPTFIAHNIRLDDGRTTMPELPWTLDQSSVVHATGRLLDLAFPAGRAGRSIVDVGCLEGGHTVEFARTGMIATGLEVRDSNLANCRYVQRNLHLDTLRFVQDDAMNIARHGPFDAVFACGLLYHLDRPRAFLTDAASVCKRMIVLHTHIANVAETPAREHYRLSDIAENEGAEGRWYTEYHDVTTEQLDAMRETSWSNKRSFWLTKACLLQSLRDVGFDTVLECFDCMSDIRADMTDGYYARQDRVLIVGLKSGVAPGVAEQMDIMRRSTSWRVTAPLRALGRAVRSRR